MIPNRGFTLIELLAAITILAMMVTWLLTIRQQSIEQAQRAKNARQAWTLARSKYHSLKTKSRQGGSLQRNGTFQGNNDFRWEVRSTEKVIDYEPTPEELVERNGEDRSIDDIRARRTVRHVTLSVYYPDPMSETEKEISLNLILFPKLKSGDQNEGSNERTIR